NSVSLVPFHLFSLISSYSCSTSVTALDVSDDAGGYRSVYCMECVLSGSRTYAIQGSPLAGVRCPHFSRTIPNGGRAVLTLAQRTRNESGGGARTEFLKRTRERETPQSPTGIL